MWQIYQNFGLGSSYASVMKFGCLLTYSEYGAVGRDFPEFPPGLLEDIYQVQNGISHFTFVLALMPWAKLVMYNNNTVHHQPYVYVTHCGATGAFN